MKTQKELNIVLLEELKQQKEQTEHFKRSFEIEKNIKNGLYFFILNNGLFDKLEKYEPHTDYQNTDSHQKNLMWFVANLPETQN